MPAARDTQNCFDWKILSWIKLAMKHDPTASVIQIYNSSRMIECRATNSKSSLWQICLIFSRRKHFRQLHKSSFWLRKCWDVLSLLPRRASPLHNRSLDRNSNVAFRFESLYAVVYDMIPSDFLDCLKTCLKIWSSGALLKGLSRKQNLRLSGRIKAFFARCIELVQIPIWRKIQEICVLLLLLLLLLLCNTMMKNNDHSKR